MQSKLEAIERFMREPIAIIGMSCRFPGASNPEAFWQLLRDGVDAIGEIPPDRWDINAFYDRDPDSPGKISTRWGGFLERIDHFDATFFGISPREAMHMDPQQRLLLEVAWEALEHACQPIDLLAGSQTGVFVGVSNSDYGLLQYFDLDHLDAYSATGCADNVVAGRLSYMLNLVGPCVSLDTSCSSSLVAVHLACQSLHAGECSLALAGGVSLNLSPEEIICKSRMHILAADGRCKTFDSRADGYVPSEGCGVVVLKRLSSALADGDPILALIRGSAINHDGRSNGLTAPNSQAQQALIRQALINADIDPAAIGYIETHGTGTSLGDPTEVEALAAVIGQRSEARRPCVLGAVKTNIGHTEEAAGMAGLIKVVLALRHEVIPANLHFHELNPRIQLDCTKFVIPTSPQPWAGGVERRYAGINSFGWSGTNAHVVLEEAPQHPSELEPTVALAGEEQAYVLPLSARDAVALTALAHAYQDMLSTSNAPTLSNVCYTASVRRTHHPHRLALVGASAAEMAEHLGAFLKGEASPGLSSGQLREEREGKLVFVFPGQGSQWLGMGRKLLEREPVFHQAIVQCAAAFDPYVDWNLLEQLTAANPLDTIDRVQPTLFAIEVGLAALWQAWGVTPAAVVGHSMGEVAAAYIAGALSLGDAACIICRRSQLLRRISGQGAMAMVELSLQEAQAAMLGSEDRLAVAVSNSRRETVLSGEPGALEAVLADLERRQVFCRRVKVDVAAHSPQVEPLLPELLQLLAEVKPRNAVVPIYSTVDSTVLEGRELDAEYWVRNLRVPVRFSAALQQLVADGHIFFLEVSPHPLLLPAIESELRELGHDSVALPSLQRGSEERATLLGSLGALYTQGYALDWRRLSPAGGRCVGLPSYPWQRERYWLEEVADRAPGSQVRRSGRAKQNKWGDHPLLGKRVSSAERAGTHYWQKEVSLAELTYLADHQVQGMVVIPGAAYLELALAGAREIFGDGSHALEQVAFKQMFVLREEEVRTIQLSITEDKRGGARFRIFSRLEGTTEPKNGWSVHASGSIRVRRESVAEPEPLALADIEARCSERIGTQAYYATLAEQGLEYGPCFQGIAELWRGKGEALARLELTATALVEAYTYLVHPALLDACFQTLGSILPHGASATRANPYLPVSSRYFSIYRTLQNSSDLWVHARLRESMEVQRGTFEGDFFLIGNTGQIIAEVKGLGVQHLERDLQRHRKDEIGKWFYKIQWEHAASLGQIANGQGPPTNGRGTWLLFVDGSGLGRELASQLEVCGETCVVVALGERFRFVKPGHYMLNPKDPEAYRKLLKHAFGADLPPCCGIVHLWSLESPLPPVTTLTSLVMAQELVCESVLYLVQAVVHAGWRDQPRLWLATRGVQAVGAEVETITIAQSTLWGLGNVIAHEYPKLRSTRIDLSPEAYPGEVQRLFDEIWSDSPEDQVALRPEGRYVARLVHYTTKAASDAPRALVPANRQPFRLEITQPGTLENLTLRATSRCAPGPDEVEIQVAAAGLNFYDVLQALGVYPGQEGGPLVLGGECAGTISAIGSEVLGLQVGDAVVACASGSIGSFLTVPSSFVVPKPAQLSFEQAASLPMVFMTAYYSLHHLARLAPGERVLIHSATGGVGLAAVQLAQQVGAVIFATAGTLEKRAFLQRLGVPHVMDSRSLAFAQEILASTNGQGVDVVLNSLTGGAIPASLATLGMYGRFVEVGKKDIYEDSQLNLSPFRKSLSYFSVDLAGMASARPLLFQELLRQVMEGFAEGTLQPLPLQVFPIAEASAAFQKMAQGKHIGKIVISMSEQERVLVAPAAANATPVREDGTYLISGGLGGLGLTVVRWLISQGARHLALMGRHAPSAEALEVLAELRAMGAAIQVFEADVVQTEQVAKVLEAVACSGVPLRGIIHAAGVLDDGVLMQLTAPQFERVLAPKLCGAWNLHTLTQEQALDFFVLFSSVASVLGSPGQGNYAAANAFLDALAHHRHASRLPALSINWGPWGQVGLASVQANRGERLAYRGMGSLTPSQGLEALEWLLQSREVQVCVLPLNLRQWQQYYPRVAATALFCHLVQEQDAPMVTQPGRSQLRETLLAANSEQRLSLLEAHLCEHIAQVLRLPLAHLDRNTPLGSLGLDSLMALELRNRLEDSLELSFPVTLIWNYQSVAALAIHLAEKIQQTKVPVEKSGGIAFSTEESAELALLLEEINRLTDHKLQQTPPSKLSTTGEPYE
jgi:acyl transferase domain-containing protein/acyl carrier protein